MENQQEQDDDSRPSPKPDLVQSVFNDFEARSNIVNLFDLLLRIDKRVNPQDYQLKQHND